MVAIFVCLMPWAGNIYDILATPMLQTLPEGTRMIATGVVTPFFVPVKVTLMLAFVLALPVVLFRPGRSWRPGYTPTKAARAADGAGQHRAVPARHGVLLLLRFRTVFHFIAEFAPKSITPAPDIEQYLSFVMTMFMAFGLTFEVPVIVVLLVRVGVVDVAKLKRPGPMSSSALSWLPRSSRRPT